MFNLFNKGSKVRAGNQKNQEEKKQAVAAPSSTTHALRQNNLLGEAWKKLQKMDRKQAYTWGAVAVVSLVALISIASVGGPEAEDFNNFETRGYDLANMPFSTDEAEQYLLASKYPDLNDKGHAGLYSKSEKEARQAEDAAQAEQAKLDASVSSTASQYRPGRYGGGSGGGAASPTQVGSLSSANLKSASGSGMKSTFGPQGDFSNFRTQEKGSDKFLPKGPGKGDARKALFQTAQASRAAANLKNDKLINAKKAMMGGNVQGSDAFMEDGKINLDNLKGLELDTNAPMESADLSGLDDAVGDANKAAAEKQHEEEEMEWWEEALIDIGKQIVSGLISMGMNTSQNAINAAQAERAAKQQQYQMELGAIKATQLADQQALSNANDILDGNVKGYDNFGTDGKTMTTYDANNVPTTTTYTRNNAGEVLRTVRVGEGTPQITNLTTQAQRSAAQYIPMDRKPTEQQLSNAIRSGEKLPDHIVLIDGKVYRKGSENVVVGTYNEKTGQFTYEPGKSGSDLKGGWSETRKWNNQQKDRLMNLPSVQSAGSKARVNIYGKPVNNYNANATLQVGDIRTTDGGKQVQWNGKEWIDL